MINKYLGAWIMHLEKRTVERLRNNEFPIEVYPYEGGVFILVPYNLDRQHYDLAGDLLCLLGYAKSLNYSAIWLDEDAEEHSELQTYEWTWEESNK